MDIGDLETYAQALPAFKPLVDQIFDGLKVYNSHYTQIEDFLIATIVKTKSSVYHGLIEKGVPAEHAVMLTIGAMNEIKEAAKTQRKTK